MNNTKKYSMNYDEAQDTLQSIFDACDVSHNTVPFDKIMLKSRIEVRPISHVKHIAILFLILVIISPLTFKKNKDFTVLNNGFRQPLIVSDHQLFDYSFSMTVKGSGIIYSEIKAIKDNGAIIFPESIDEETGVIVFPYDGDALSICVPNIDGYKLRAVLSERK